jgi:hypothetical protein
MNNKYAQSIIAGLAGTTLLLAIYWLVLYWTTKDFYHPVQQIIYYKYWMLPLLAGFALQLSLFWYLRLQQKTGKTSRGALAGGAGTSTLAMVACCAHHLVDFLPILGLSAAALLLSRYQSYFFLLGIFSNLAGIIIMIRLIKKYRPLPDTNLNNKL